jgi:hypothetical protein
MRRELCPFLVLCSLALEPFGLLDLAGLARALGDLPERPPSWGFPESGNGILSGSPARAAVPQLPRRSVYVEGSAIPCEGTDVRRNNFPRWSILTRGRRIC